MRGTHCIQSVRGHDTGTVLNRIDRKCFVPRTAGIPACRSVQFKSRMAPTDQVFHMMNFLRPQQPASNASLDAVQQFQPVVKRWFWHALPLFVPPTP